MSFGGFGSNNTNTGFGGFGSNNNTNTTSSGSLFGSGTSTSGTGFGSGGGFGSNNTSNPFGAKPTGFGSTATTSSGSMFGANTSTSGTFGSGGSGFGSNNNASTGFGASNNTSTGGGLFGQNKPATTGFGGGGSLFGSSNTNTGFGSSTTQSNPFGGGSNTTNTGFGSGNTTGNTGFGASNTGGSGFGGFGNNAGAASTAGNNNQGTSVTPFTAFTEKDGQGSTASNVAYQSITFQQPYQTKSFEELRLEDYMQNRRYPQSGSFGGSTSTFTGFGQQNNTGSSLFGANNNTSTGSGFGASNTNTGFGSNTNTGFGGSNTGGGLFGQNKPAGGSLFGNNAASSGTTTTGFGATAPSGGNLFGNNNQSTGTGFGGGNSTFGSNNNNTGGSLFGGANQTQNKPAFGGFGGQNNTNTTGGTGFGGFGNNNQQQQGQQQGSSLFGGSNNAAGGGFGSNNTGGSLFGNNQAKPAGGGLFGNSTTGTNNTSTGGLFGNNNNNTQQQQGGSLFGGSTNNTTGGSLFGGNNQSNTGGSSLFGNTQNKPAGGGLFGASTTGTNTGGSLFGNNQQQSNTGGSLFGGNNQNQQNTGGSLFGNNQNKPAGGLFGNTGTGNTGGSLFGNTQNNNNSGSLFGGNNANQNQSGGSSLFGGNNQNAGSSLFGGSQQNQQQPNTLQATLTGNPYGNAQLFSSLAAPSPPVGPLVTPLSNTKPPPRPRASLLASVRGTSSLIGSPGHTPRPTRPGYGFSYSTYNSPVNGAQSLTPGAAGLLRPTGSLNSSMAGRLSKSFSTSNLRGDGPEGQSLLRTPVAAQSPLLLGGGSLGSGSARKLRIDRSVRNDLFGEPPKQKQVEAAKDQDQGMRKRVSFDNNTQDATSTPSASNAVVVRDNDEDQTPRATPEGPRVNGLSSVPEDSVPQQSSATASPKSRKPVEPGEYYSKPTINQLKDMSRQERSRVTDFIVGRHNVGWIVFGKGKPVDLTQVSLDDIQGGIVQLNLRSATVYQDDANKPAVGQGLNVPSTIFLEQSWPRSSRVSGVTPQAGTMAAKKEIEAHKRRLRKVGGTDFKDYNPDTGLWSFTVEHFTTYELDDDDDDEEDMDEDTGMLDLQPKVPSSMRTASSALSEPPATGASAQRSMDMVQSEVDSPDLGEQDDTFEFKLAKRSQQSNISVPGGFGGETMGNVSYDYDDPSADEMQEELDVSDNQGDESMEDPFIEAGGAVQAVSPGAVEQYHSSILEDEVDEAEQGVSGSFRAEPAPPKSILKPTPAPAYASPEKVAELPWEDQLQRTLSPKKRDRQALRDMQGSLARAMPDATAEESPFKKTLFSRSQLGQSYLATKSAKKSGHASTMGGNNDLGKSQAFTTGMDLINSLWGQPQKGASKTKGAFSEIPYPSKRPRLSDADMNEQDAQFHESFKPSFDNRNTLIYSVPGSAPHVSDGMGQSIRSLVGEGKDVRFAKFDRPVDFDSPALDLLNQYTQLEVSEEPESVPHAITSEEVHFIGFAQLPYDQTGKQEKAIWRLCSILFDPLEACAQETIEGMSDEQVMEYEPKIRDDLFLDFWSELITPTVETQMKKTRSAEEKAVLLLTKGDIVGASQTLMDAGDVRLATIISQLPGNETSREIVKSQLRMWRDRKDWSEFSDAHKALYSILAGEVCTVAGVTGAPEDRAQPFCISERFGLDWKQALALQVQFGGHESLVDAVRALVAEIQEGNEKVSTRPSHMQGDGEDTLLGLLKLEALQDGDVEKVFDPATVSGSALNSRVAWQLANLLTTTQICELSEEKLDQLAVDFAMQLEAAGDWTKAAWTLLHLTDAEARTNAITGLLERNAAHLPAPNQDEAMMDDSAAWTPAGLQLPASLIWSAKALYAAAVLHEPALQADYLLNTGLDSAFIEAHDVLCRNVGPTAIIEQDYSDLTALLEHFSAVGAEDFEEWKLGGNIYALFLRLISLSPGRKEGREGKLACTALKKELQQLEQAELDAQGISLEMRVARMEMRRVLKETMREIGLESKRGFEGGEARKGKVEDMLVEYRRALGVVA